MDYSALRSGLAATANQILKQSGWGQLVNADIANAAAIAYSKLNLAGSILNADVANAAAIAYSKLNLAGSILNADINSAAAIAYSKLNLGASIVNADIANAAAIAYSKLNLATSIVNADINSSAAIALSKLAATTSGLVRSNGSVMSGGATVVNADVDAAAAIAYSKLDLTNHIVAGDLTDTAAWKKIATVNGSGASGVMEFSSIPNTFQALQVVYYGRTDAAVTATLVKMTFETSPSAGFYYYEQLRGNSTSATAVENAGTSDYIHCGVAVGTSGDASSAGFGNAILPNYAHASLYKGVIIQASSFLALSAGNLFIDMFAGIFKSTSAIDRIRLTPNAGNWTTTSRAVLYGLPL